MATTPKSFYQFLNEQAIEIPILQRDYAQGRKGKEALRRTFLKSLKMALDDAVSKGCATTPLQLDFVYGSADCDKLQPLDGQQRLTTLWLLHWYIALRADVLKSASSTLKRFGYETRLSSRQFCEKMCNPQNFEAFQNRMDLPDIAGNVDETRPNNSKQLSEGDVSIELNENIANNQTIADFISSRTWFYAKWKQDPTIQSMLRMLSGDKEGASRQDKRRKSKKDLQIDFDDDAIEKIFASTTKAEFVKYWELLTSDHSPIVFYHLPLKKFGLSDDLYVKMNARGKALTPFENFKADLIGYIRSQREQEVKKGNDESSGERLANTFSWDKITDPRAGVPILLDTSWTNIFWKYRSKKNEIDGIFLTFLNRYFWNELICTDIPIDKNPSYIHLNKDNGNSFDDFAPYRYNNGEIPSSFFADLSTVMERFGKINRPIEVPNFGKFNYRPVYVYKDGTDIEVVEEITQPGRILFFAVTKYFKDGEYDETSFRRWMRVVGNLISGVDEKGSAQIRSIEQVRNVISKLSTLSSHEIYECLVNPDIYEGIPQVIKSRFNEEIDKARQILTDNCDGLREYPNKDEFATWEEAIAHYETFNFFKGSIRFLYRNEDGNPSWDDFKTKANVATEYFSKENGVYCNITGDNSTKGNPELLKILYSRTDADGFWQAIWWNYHVFSNNDNSWLHLLKHSSMTKAVHHLLMKEEVLPQEKPTSNDFAEVTLYLLSQTRLLNYVAKQICNPWIRYYHNHRAIFPSATGIFLDATFRDNFLQNTEGVELTTDCKVEDTGLLFGSNIDFSYCEHNFRWYDSDNVYLTTGAGTNCEIRDAAGQNNEEKYYMFKAKDINDEQVIIDKLDNLISEYKNTKG